MSGATTGQTTDRTRWRRPGRRQRLRAITRPRAGRTRYSESMTRRAHTSMSWRAPRLRIVDATWRSIPPEPPRNGVEIRILTTYGRAVRSSPVEHEEAGSVERGVDSPRAGTRGGGCAVEHCLPGEHDTVGVGSGPGVCDADEQSHALVGAQGRGHALPAVHRDAGEEPPER